MSTETFFSANAVDLEGTGVDLEDIHAKSFEEVASRQGVIFGQDEFRQFVGAGDEAIAKAIAEMFGSDADHRTIRAQKNDIYRAVLHSHPVMPREGFVEYLEEVRSLGGKLVIASITPDGDAEYILRRSGLLKFFQPDHILTESSVTNRKPHPEIYTTAARILGVSTTPERMLVHEDSPTGVTAGKRAGARVAAFPVHEGLQFPDAPDATFSSWVGVTPKVVYDRVMSARPRGSSGR